MLSSSLLQTLPHRMTSVSFFLVQHILNEREVEALIRSSHRPNYVTRMIAEIIDTAKLTDSEVFLMDTNLSFFMDAAGGCERIFKTPIPLSWTSKAQTEKTSSVRSQASRQS